MKTVFQTHRGPNYHVVVVVMYLMILTWTCNILFVTTSMVHAHQVVEVKETSTLRGNPNHAPRLRTATTTTSTTTFSHPLTGQRKQAEVIHHPIHIVNPDETSQSSNEGYSFHHQQQQQQQPPPPNGYGLIYYYNHSNVIQHYLLSSSSSMSSTMEENTYRTTSSANTVEMDDMMTSTTTTMMDVTTNPYPLTIYKEPKLYTSVGTAHYTCHHPTSTTNSHDDIDTTGNAITTTTRSILCHIQIIFYSSNIMTNRTTNTIQMQGILQHVVVAGHNDKKNSHDDNPTSTTTTAAAANNNNNNMAIIGGTGIYHGANGYARFNRTSTTSSHPHSYKTVATFSIQRPSLPSTTTTTTTQTATAAVSSHSHHSIDMTTSTINATFPIVDTTTTAQSLETNVQSATQLRIRRRHGHENLQWTVQQMPPKQPHPDSKQEVVPE